MSMFKRTLCAASAAIILGLTATAAQAQTTTPTSTYAYSASISVGSPTGSSTAGTPPKNRPASVKALPCLTTTTDTLTFTLKYDAGKLPATPDGEVQLGNRQDMYLIFHKEGATTPFVYLFRQDQSAVGGITPPQILKLAAVADVAALNTAKSTATYYSATKVPSGPQTEIILGSQIDLAGLDSGTWTVTAIIADKVTVDFDDPSTWTAWDSAPFVLRKPWKGSTNNTCK